MDSYDGDLMLLLLMDDDLFFIDISVDEEGQNNVERIQPESVGKARR
jgi:hypothetical protein